MIDITELVSTPTARRRPKMGPPYQTVDLITNFPCLSAYPTAFREQPEPRPRERCRPGQIVGVTTTLPALSMNPNL